MCDCYGHGCAVPGCREVIPMHLEDFETARYEIEVYCGEHIPADTSDGVMWAFSDKETQKRPRVLQDRCFVRALTANARGHADGNLPNVFWCDKVEGE